ncbi:hypothetical protein VHEMI09100 [[Torrubiella] hemipterigena]|uniref:Uncharacterized protein n=1 Tax=[Torrubiella] hemipterigena TaxID=1531966 RepID=A0A0A1TFF7_9HYPO|nr:hypothetical protein VHEMI09100 [[Torrubiella] hemipterigena]
MERVFACVGLVTAAIIAAKAFIFLRIYLLPSNLHRYIHNAADGRQAWVLVTGASDGIGRSLAQELAANGLNVVLHGRNREKLATVMSELQQLFPKRSFRILIADASQVRGLTHNKTHETGVDFESIKESLDDLHLTILINNAGGGPVNPVCLPFSESSEERVTANVSLNALFPAHLIRVLFTSSC